MILYWVTTEDHFEDWFVLAPSPEEATQYFENYEGYNEGDAEAEEIIGIKKGRLKAVRLRAVRSLMKLLRHVFPNSLRTNRLQPIF